MLLLGPCICGNAHIPPSSVQGPTKPGQVACKVFALHYPTVSQPKGHFLAPLHDTQVKSKALTQIVPSGNHHIRLLLFKSLTEGKEETLSGLGLAEAKHDTVGKSAACLVSAKDKDGAVSGHVFSNLEIRTSSLVNVISFFP